MAKNPRLQIIWAVAIISAALLQVFWSALTVAETVGLSLALGVLVYLVHEKVRAK